MVKKDGMILELPSLRVRKDGLVFEKTPTLKIASLTPFTYAGAF